MVILIQCEKWLQYFNWIININQFSYRHVLPVRLRAWILVYLLNWELNMNTIHTSLSTILLEMGLINVQRLSFCRSPVLFPFAVLFCYLHLQRDLKKLEWIWRRGIVIRLVSRTYGNYTAMACKYFCLNSLIVYSNMCYSLYPTFSHKSH